MIVSSCVDRYCFVFMDGLNLDQLRNAVQVGWIDMVLLVFIDMQGWL